MSSEMVVTAADTQRWSVRNLGDVDRVSGTELGRQLGYSRKQPTIFNKMVIEKLLKEGKINDFDIVKENLQCRKGFGHVPVTEYWLPLPMARSIALNHVRTQRANKLREQVVEQLEALIKEKREALQAPTTDYAALVLAVQQQMHLLQQHTERLEALSQPKAPPSIYIDDERAHLLKRMAQDLTAARGEGSVQSIWRAVQRKYNFIKAKRGKHPRVFETVTVNKFDAVLAELSADLDKALSTPTKVSSILRRTSVAAGNSVDVHYVGERLNRMLAPAKVEVPLYALPRLYALANLMVYPRPNGKTPDLRIDEADIRKLIAWCSDHPHELEVFLESEKELHQLKASSGRRRGAAVAE